MRIARARIRNYKSFVDTEISFSGGFNVVVGKNNCGKTALLEAISTGYENHPHRSLETAPFPSSRVNDPSSVTLWLEFGPSEALELLETITKAFVIPTHNARPGADQLKDFDSIFRSGATLRLEWRPKSIVDVRVVGYLEDGPYQSAVRASIVRDPAIRLSHGGDAPGGGNIWGFAHVLAEHALGYVYRFKAERLPYARAALGPTTKLSSDAGNLAQVLGNLRSTDMHRFETLLHFLSQILPDITDVATPAVSDSQGEIRLWSLPRNAGRSDLAVPLSESGTGVGQVLAMLYVLVASDWPSVLVIDEPQSFLHPGALRTLLEIFASHPQHQYIIATHSPAVISAANPCRVLLLQKKEMASAIQLVDSNDGDHLRSVLGEVGARIADVFGADEVLWVEGSTEELCLPVIKTRLLESSLDGVVILGLIAADDLRRKDKEKVLKIYNRLTRAGALMPPKVSFLLDREGLSDKDVEDLERQGIHILPRRMIENYLLVPEAIAAILSELEGKEIAADAVEDWMTKCRGDRKYFDPLPVGDHANWLKAIRGDQLLMRLFREITTGRHEYSKTEHGPKLTRWLCENQPTMLSELARTLQGAISA